MKNKKLGESETKEIERRTYNSVVNECVGLSLLSGSRDYIQNVCSKKGYKYAYIYIMLSVSGCVKWQWYINNSVSPCV